MAKRADIASLPRPRRAPPRGRRAESLLHDIALIINSALDLDTILTRVVELSMELVEAEAGALALLSRDRKRYLSANTIQMPAALQIANTAVSPNVKRVIRSRQPLILNRYAAQPYAHPALVEDGVQAVLIAPVLAGEEVLGVLTVCRRRRAARFYKREAARLVSVAQQAGVAIVNARRYDVERQRVRELEALRTTMADISAKMDLSMLVPAVVQRVVELLGAQEGALALFDPASRTLALLARHNVNVATAPMPNPRLGEGLLGQVALLRQPLIINDYLHWPHRLSVFPDSQLPVTALGVPLLAGDQLVGALGVYHFSAGREFDARDAQLLGLFAQQVTTAVQNAQLYQAAVKDAERRALLYQASQEIGRQLDPEQLYLTIHQTTQSLMPCEAFVIALIDRERNELDFVYLIDREVRVPGERRPLNHGLTGYAILNGESLRVDDFSAPEAARYNAVDFGDPTETTLSGLVALMRRGGQVLGALSVQAYPRHAYTDTDLHMLELLAANAAIAIENARLYQAALKDADRRALLYQASQEISGHLRPEPLYAAIHRAAQRLMPCDAFIIGLLDEAHHELEFTYLYEANQLWPGFRRSVREGLVGYVIGGGVSRRIDDLEIEEQGRFVGIRFGQAQRVRSALVALMRRGGHVIGAITAQAYAPAAYSAADLDTLELLAAHAAIAIESARLFTEVQGLATVDELTGVWNRRQFFAMADREMERAARYPRPLAILLLDADHFKRVNDSYGHAVGDQVLRALATRCLNNLREQDMLGRYGGEEFVILLPETDADGAQVVAERLCTRIAASPVMTTVGNVSLTASIGVANRSAADTCALEELLERADQALYRAKNEGRNRVVVWEKMTPPARADEPGG